MPKSNELERSRLVVMLKVNIIVNISMMEAIFATLHEKNTIVINIKKWQIVLMEGLLRVAIRGIDHEQLLTGIVFFIPHRYGTGSVWGDSGWYLVELGHYGAVLGGTWWYWVSITWYCLV